MNIYIINRRSYPEVMSVWDSEEKAEAARKILEENTSGPYEKWWNYEILYARLNDPVMGIPVDEE